MKTSVIEKGEAAGIHKWFKKHKDEKYADILEKVVKDMRDNLSLNRNNFVLRKITLE